MNTSDVDQYTVVVWSSRQVAERRDLHRAKVVGLDAARSKRSALAQRCDFVQIYHNPWPGTMLEVA